LGLGEKGREEKEEYIGKNDWKEEWKRNREE
jgi:hypothetical protein